LVLRILSAASEEAKTVGHDDLWISIPLHRTAEKLKRCLAGPAVRGKNFDDLTVMINGAPEVRSEQKPHQYAKTSMNMIGYQRAVSGSRQRIQARTGPPEPDSLVADVDAAIQENIFELLQR
jgi:hypothetical protein